jgi:hypothetical protein
VPELEAEGDGGPELDPEVPPELGPQTAPEEEPGLPTDPPAPESAVSVTTMNSGPPLAQPLAAKPTTRIANTRSWRRMPAG